VITLVYPIFKRILYLLARIFVKKVEGIENIPKKGPFIVASNHTSYLDILIAHYIIRKTNQKIHFIVFTGRFSFFGETIIKKWLGCIPIRYNKKEIKVALEEAVSILKKGGIVGIFPAAPQNDLTKPKTGVVRIALAAKCPVLPVVIIGANEALPPSSFIPRRLKHVSLQFKKPMTLKKTQKNLDVIAQKISRVILLGLKQK